MTNPHRIAELESLLDEARGHIRALLHVGVFYRSVGAYNDAQAFLAKPNPAEGERRNLTAGESEAFDRALARSFTDREDIAPSDTLIGMDGT